MKSERALEKRETREREQRASTWTGEQVLRNVVLGKGSPLDGDIRVRVGLEEPGCQHVL